MKCCFSRRTTLSVALLLGTTTLSQAAILGIDSVTLNGDDSLATATVGGVAYAGGTIADAVEDNGGTAPSSPLGAFPASAGSAAPSGRVVSASDAQQGLAYDNSVKTGVAGATNTAGQNGGALVLRWGDAGFTDNDAGPDFFVFEDLGNDTVEVQAILSEGTLGASITLSGWNALFTDGALGTNTNVSTTLSGRTISGVSFGFTDLLDAAGASLTAGATIQGIVIGDTGSADFYEVYASIDRVAIPEPTAMLMTVLATACGCYRRR